MKERKKEAQVNPSNAKEWGVEERQKEEKILLERSVQNTSVKERHRLMEYRYSHYEDGKLRHEPLFFCACTCMSKTLYFLTGVQCLPGFGAGAVRLNNFQDLGIFFKSGCTWEREGARGKNVGN